MKVLCSCATGIFKRLMLSLLSFYSCLHVFKERLLLNVLLSLVPIIIWLWLTEIIEPIFFESSDQKALKGLFLIVTYSLMVGILYLNSNKYDLFYRMLIGTTLLMAMGYFLYIGTKFFQAFCLQRSESNIQILFITIFALICFFPGICALRIQSTRYGNKVKAS